MQTPYLKVVKFDDVDAIATSDPTPPSPTKAVKTVTHWFKDGEE